MIKNPEDIALLMETLSIDLNSPVVGTVLDALAAETEPINVWELQVAAEFGSTDEFTKAMLKVVVLLLSHRTGLIRVTPHGRFALSAKGKAEHQRALHSPVPSATNQ